MRRLLYTPVIHSGEDMGSMAEPLKREYIRQFGIAKWRQHVRTVEDMWEGIKQKLNALDLDYKKLKIYQDGLPVCGREMDIVRDVARLGSHNYRIILEKVKDGAQLIGTEDPKLLIEEYNFIKNFTGVADSEKRRDVVKKAQKRRDALLVERDRFVAKKISETLNEGEVGILFSGIEHEIDRYLPKDIKIEYIIYRLPFRRIQLHS